MAETLDDLEARDPAQRERDLMQRLPQLVAQAKRAPGWARILGDIDAASVTSREALARLPVTRKSELKGLQQQDKPFGGLTSTPPRELAHAFREAAHFVSRDPFDS